MNARVADVLFTCEYFKHITNIISILLRHFTFTSVHMESKTADYYHVHLYIYILYNCNEILGYTKGTVCSSGCVPF